MARGTRGPTAGEPLARNATEGREEREAVRAVRAAVAELEDASEAKDAKEPKEVLAEQTRFLLSCCTRPA